MTDKYIVIGQEWEESEAGWGCRADGWSFHKTEKHHEDYCKKYWAKMPDGVQDEYSREFGPIRHVEVSKALYDKVHKDGDIRLWMNNVDAYKDWVEK